MQQSKNWDDLISETQKLFPEIDHEKLTETQGDIRSVVREVARAHDLTLSEATELVSWRLPDDQPDYQVRLSA